MTGTDRFTIGFYFQSLTRLLSTPKVFFADLPETMGYRQSFTFLLVSALFFTGVSLTYFYETSMVMALILLVNALAMPFIGAGICFMIMKMTMNKSIGFEKLFALFAFASGVTMLLSWIPKLFWLTEPWRWMLICIGMVKACGFRWIQAVFLMAVTMAILCLLFWSFAPVILSFKRLVV